MKFAITMKSADCIYDAVEDAAGARSDADIAAGIGYTNRDEMIEHNKATISEAIKKWVLYEEYVTIDIDTILQTAIVRENL